MASISFEVLINGRRADFGYFNDEGDMMKAIHRAETLSKDYKNVTVLKHYTETNIIWQNSPSSME